ncbi:MAG TPA: hypothetical protein VI299_04915 [Polyangiales bacterium]
MTSLFALGAGIAACNQPAPKCGLARGMWSARYTLVPGSKVGEGDCDTLVGDILQTQSYTQKKKDSPYPDPNHIQIGIQPYTLSSALERAGCSEVANGDGLFPYSLGSFAKSEPGSDDFCTVPTLTPARVVLPEQGSCQPDMCQPPLPVEPAADYTYEWSNVRVYVTASANGTQFAADLKYTKDGCSAQYKVTALFSVVDCASYPNATPPASEDAGTEDGGLDDADGGVGEMDAAIDSDAEVSDDAATSEDTGTTPSDCPAPEATPDQGAPVPDDSLCAQDTTINPEFMVQCDPQLLRCVLSSDPPSLR